MKSRKLLTALACTAVLAGCATPYSEAPLATNFPTSKQVKLQAAAHWNTIASDVARHVSADLKDKPALYVNQASVKTDFDRAFSNQLISALVQEGLVVQKAPAGALSLDIDTQSVQFSANRPQYNYAGTATVLTAGVWALHKASPAGAASAGIIAADAYQWFRSEFASGATPQTEIIITTSVSDSHRYLARQTSVYYVADADQRLYQAPAPTTSIRVTGGK